MRKCLTCCPEPGTRWRRHLVRVRIRVRIRVRVRFKVRVGARVGVRARARVSSIGCASLAALPPSLAILP